MTGKEKCNLLKDIRVAVAAANNIAFLPHDCEQQNLCSGTCAQCEKEAAYLNKEIERVIQEGELVYIPNTYFERMQNVVIPEGGIYSSKSISDVPKSIDEPLAGDIVVEDEGGWDGGWD